MTNKEMFEAISNVLPTVKDLDEAVVTKFNDFKDNQLAKLERDAAKRAEKVEKSHKAIIDLIMADNFDGKTATEITDALKDKYETIKDEDEKSLSVQKISSVVKGMIENGKATKAKAGKKVTYNFVR